MQFLSRGEGYTLFLTSRETVLTLTKPVPKQSQPYGLRKAAGAGTLRTAPSTVLRLELTGANRRATVTREDELPTRSNYFIGDDPNKWYTDIHNYGKVRYRDIYTGVDLLYYGNQRQLEHDFVVAPGADPSVIALAMHGASELRLDQTGDLVVHAAGCEVRLLKPVIYQVVNGVRREVSGRYVLKAGNKVGFDIAKFDRHLPLVIDPVLSYSTYLGGSDSDSIGGIAVDAAGNVYLAGHTSSLDFPTANALQPTNAGGLADVFVTKLNAAGSALVYSTYLGGSGIDHILSHGLAVDSAGNVYITGDTDSPDFPLVSALQSNRPGGMESFVVKLKSTGDALGYSTYLGGSSDDNASDIAVDLSGNAYVTGTTASVDFPTAGAIQRTLRGVEDAFVTKINSNGSALVYSTYLGGSGSEEYERIAVDSDGNAYITGNTSSTDFPLVNAMQADLKGGLDAFVTKVNPDGSAILYSTYLGGNNLENSDQAGAIEVDSGGNAYVTGSTLSPDFPTTAGAFDRTCAAGHACAYVTKVNARGSALLYSTYLGDNSSGRGIAVDALGNAYVTGHTFGGFPTASPVQTRCGGDCSKEDAFVTKLNPAASALVFSTYLGGSNEDGGSSIAVDSEGSAYIAGYTRSPDFPTVNAMQAAPGVRDYDAFVAKISLSGTGTDFAVSVPVGASASSTVNAGQTATYTVDVVPTGFTGTVALTCNWVSLQPVGTTCTISPASVDMNGSDAVHSTVMVTTTARSVSAGARDSWPWASGLQGSVPFVLGLAGVIISFILAMPRGRGLTFRLMAPLLLAVLWTSCGSSSAPPSPPNGTLAGTPAGTYQLKILGTAGGVTRTTFLTLKVN